MQVTMIPTITTIVHYAQGDLHSDYYDVEVVVVTPHGNIIKGEWGDSYHDKGREKAEGFVEAMKLIFPQALIAVQHVDDREDIG